MRTIAIIPAGGAGRRLGARERKPFVLLKGRELITYALEAVNSSGCIDGIVVAVEAPFIKRLKGIIRAYGFKKVLKVVKGGKTRYESVRNCFNAIDPSVCDIVLIHDGARPFLKERLIRDAVGAAGRFGACIAAIPVTDTVKLAGKSLFVKKTLDRKRLWRAQTPQAFRYGLFKEALKRVKGFTDMTDDASIPERIGKRVKILEGSPANIKITTKEDLKMAEVFLCE